MIPTKAMTPHVPVTVQEIVEDIHEAVEIGITMVHVHARNERTGEPTYKAEVYGDIIAGIRKFSRDLVVAVSLSGRTFKEFEKRAEPLGLQGDSKPDMGSRVASIETVTEWVSLLHNYRLPKLVPPLTLVCL